MFKLHNTVSVEMNGETVCVCNEVTGIAAAVASGKKYGNYVVLKGGDGDRALLAEVTEMNINPLSQPFVTKTVSIEGEEFRFHSAGLSPDGKETVNLAYLGEIVKPVGAAMSVSVTVCLQWETADATFCGGENGLIKFLLGEGGLGEFTIGIGKDYSPLSQSERDDGNFISVYPAQFTLNESGMTFSAQHTSEIYEAVVLMDGKAVLRAAFKDSNPEVKTGSKKPNAAGTVLIGNTVSQVFNVAQNGVPISDFKLHDNYRSVGQPIKLNIRVSPAARLITDGDFKYAAAVSPREAAIFTVKDNRISLISQLRLEGDSSKVQITPDGSLFECSAASLRRVSFDALSEEYFDVGEPDDFRVVYDRTHCYHMAGLYGRTVKRFKLLDKKAEEIESFQLTGDEKYFIGKFDGITLDMGGAGNPCKVCTLQNELVYQQQTVEDIMETFIPVECLLDGYMMYLKDADGIKYAINIFDYNGFDIASGGEEVLANGELCMDNSYIYAVNIPTEDIAMLQYNFDAEVKDAVRLQNYVLRLRRNGQTDCLVLCSTFKGLSSRQFLPSQNVTYNYITPRSFMGSSGVRAVVKVEF